MKALQLSSLIPIAIMPGRNPLGTPTGISPDLEEEVARFHAQHGALPIIVIIPRELRPGQALSWQAFFASTPQGPSTEAPGELEEVLLAITGRVGRMESQRCSERTRAGLARALAQGKRLGSPPGSRGCVHDQPFPLRFAVALPTRQRKA